MDRTLWCGECGGTRRYVVEHFRQWKEEHGPSVKACMCSTHVDNLERGVNRFTGTTASQFWQLEADGRVTACEPFGPHIHNGHRRQAS